MADDVIEEWRSIEQAPDYEVSNLGSVRRLTPGVNTQPGRLLKLGVGSKGYAKVHLRSQKGYVYPLVHILVCTAFHGRKPSPSHQVAHANGVKLDNRATNLRWATPVENAADKISHGTLYGGDRHWKRSPQKLIRNEGIIRDIGLGVPKSEIAQKYQISESTIADIKAGRTFR